MSVSLLIICFFLKNEYKQLLFKTWSKPQILLNYISLAPPCLEAETIGSICISCSIRCFFMVSTHFYAEMRFFLIVGVLYIFLKLLSRKKIIQIGIIVAEKKTWFFKKDYYKWDWVQHFKNNSLNLLFKTARLILIITKEIFFFYIVNSSNLRKALVIKQKCVYL